MRKNLNKSIKNIVFVVIGLIVINVIANTFYKRFDLTTDQRYTLNPSVLTILEKVESPILVDVFLEGDDFPSEFRKLQSETKQLLEELVAYNNNISPLRSIVLTVKQFYIV